MSFGWLFSDLLPHIMSALSFGVDWLIQYNNSLIEKLFENSAVIAFFSVTSFVGGIMYVAGVGFAFANFTLDNKNDGAGQVTDLIKNCFVGLTAFFSYTTVPVLFLRFTNELCSLLCRSFAAFNFESRVAGLLSGDDYDSLLSNTFRTPEFFLAVYVIIMFVAVCKVFFSNIKRGGILVTLVFVCSFHLFSIPRGYTDAFWSWCKQTAGVCITAFMQNFLIALSFFVVSVYGVSNTTTLVLSVGVALSASEVPRILQQFGLDSSMRANISQAIFATSGIVSIARAFV